MALTLVFSFAVTANSSLAAAPDEAATKAVNAGFEALLSKLPGDTAFAFTEIVDDKPVLLYGVRPEKRLAVGSTFKLYIFGTLVDEVNHGRRRVDDTMLLQANLEGPPTSEVASWPIGSPATLYTLTLKMISISDNTATDHMLYLLGRKRVEEQMGIMGHGAPQFNTPLFGTREMTMLRDKKTGMLGNEYKKLDDAGRRAMLAKLDVKKPDFENLDFDAATYDVAEWYASPLDIANALSWIRKNTEEDLRAHGMRAILSVETKFPHDPKVWPFVGFKGGSEDQLLAGNWLLKNKNGHWYTLSLYCNSPKEKIDTAMFVEALATIVKEIETTLP